MTVRRSLIPIVLSAAAILAASGCGDRSVTGPTPGSAPQASLTGDLISRLLLVDSCASLTADPVSKTIGKEGGVIAIGPDTLRIPRAALSKPVTIQASLPAGYFVNIVSFQPEGLHFKKPASLTMGYSNCTLPVDWNVRIAQVTDDLQIIEYLRSTTNRTAKTVTAPLQHFSNYAVAW